MKALCVDLDGTLLRGDLLWEQVLFLLRTQPAIAFRFLAWLPRGKAYFKERMAALPMPPLVAELLNTPVVEWVRRERAAGRRVHLVTANHRTAATLVDKAMGCFDVVSCSTATRSLSHQAKRDLLRETYGEGGWYFAGNSDADLPAWSGANQAIAVRAHPSTVAKLRRANSNVTVLSQLPSRTRLLWRAVRPHQLVKNILLFLPLIMAHRVLDGQALALAFLAFLSFCGAASSAYCVNDLIDLPADRIDPGKSHRPFASGDLTPGAGIALALGLAMASAAVSLLLPRVFQFSLALYFAGTLAYSLVLKRWMSADIVVLTCLYTLRVEAGGLATNVPVSQWLLSFSVFFFLTLSSLKRYGELLGWQDRLTPSERLPGRGYEIRDRESIRAFGCASGYVAVLVFILYVNSDAVARLYRNPQALWCIGPLLVYWINRIWILAGRGVIRGDPIPFVFSDLASYIVVTAVALVMLAASLLPPLH